MAYPGLSSSEQADFLDFPLHRLYELTSPPFQMQTKRWNGGEDKSREEQLTSDCELLT